MPAAVYLGPLNQMLAAPGSDAYGAAAAAANAAGSCQEAVDGLNLLEGQPDEVMAEARTVLRVLPAEVDQQILGAVRDAVAREATVVLAWEHADPGSAIRARVTEVDGEVHVVIVSPDGRTL